MKEHVHVECCLFHMDISYMNENDIITTMFGHNNYYDFLVRLSSLNFMCLVNLMTMMLISHEYICYINDNEINIKWSVKHLPFDFGLRQPIRFYRLLNCLARE